MEAKFTKGPWTANNTGYYTRVVSGGVLISEISSGNSNAHLIAAAPDMYAMLEVIAISMECCHGVDTSAIYSLLAKARGESNEK